MKVLYRFYKKKENHNSVTYHIYTNILLIEQLNQSSQCNIIIWQNPSLLSVKEKTNKQTKPIIFSCKKHLEIDEVDYLWIENGLKGGRRSRNIHIFILAKYNSCFKSCATINVIYFQMIKRSLTRSASNKEEFRLVKTRKIARICKSSWEILCL